MSKDELLDEAMKKIIDKDDGAIVDEFDLTGVVLKPFDPGDEVIGYLKEDKDEWLCCERDENSL